MLRSIGIVLRGTLAAQAIGILILPFLTRTFAPEAFGHFQFYQSVLAILLVVSTLRYEIAILRVEEPVELGAVLKLCAGINIALSLLVGIVVEICVATGWPAALADLPFPRWLIAASLLIGGTVQYLGYVVVREERYGVGANAKVAQATIYAGSAAAIGATVPVSAGIVYADFAGRCAGLAWTGMWFLRNRTGLIGRSARRDIVTVARRFREYPIVATAGGLINAAGSALTPIMIYAVFTPATSGQFALVERGVSLPIALTVVAVSQVYSAQLAKSLRAGAQGAVAYYRRLILWMALAGVAPTIALVILAKPVFALLFGPGWEQAAVFAQLLAPAFLLTFIAGGINMTLIIAGYQKTQMGWEIARLVAMAGLWLTAVPMGLAITTIVALHATIIGVSALAFILLCDHLLRRLEAGKVAVDGQAIDPSGDVAERGVS